MILILCLDDKNGMAFNRRRQSQDALAREKLLSLTAGAPLWMNAYSAKQFGDAHGITVDEAFLEKGIHTLGLAGALAFGIILVAGVTAAWRRMKGEK